MAGDLLSHIYPSNLELRVQNVKAPALTSSQALPFEFLEVPFVSSGQNIVPWRTV